MYVSGGSLLGHIGVQAPSDTAPGLDAHKPARNVSVGERSSIPRTAQRRLSHLFAIERHDHLVTVPQA
jgi:hypothetical protein